MLPVHWVTQRGHSDSQVSDSDLPYHDAVEHLESDHPALGESSASKSVDAPPTSPTSASPVTISSPDEVMEQLLHHQLEELESSHRHDDVTKSDIEDVALHICGHNESILSSVDVPTSADNNQNKNGEKRVVSDEPVKSEEPKPTPSLEGEWRSNHICVQGMVCTLMFGSIRGTL